MIFDILPKNISLGILAFLEWSDLISIKLVSRKASQLALDQKIWARECLRYYISNDLENLSDIYENPEYKKRIKSIAENLSGSAWSTLFEQGQVNKANLYMTVLQFGTSVQASNFVNYFYEQLRGYPLDKNSMILLYNNIDPKIPLLRLKRETILVSTKTMFQNKLSEVLYEDTMKLGIAFSIDESAKDLMDSLKFQEHKLIQECTNREKFMRARWYNDLEQKQGKTNDETLGLHENSDLFSEIQISKHGLDLNETELIGSEGSLLLQIVDAIKLCFVHHCAMVSEYLSKLENDYEILAEYTSRWNAYVATMIEFETSFEAFLRLFNRAYENIFVNYPSYPKFSIWRLMTKVWLQEIFQKNALSLKLKGSFQQTLNKLRMSNVKDDIAENDLLSQNFGAPNDEVPKSLYIKLKTKENRNFTLEIKETNPLEGFEGQLFEKEAEKKLLFNFLQSILDLSLNEVSIHFLNCPNVETNSPYSEFEEILLNDSRSDQALMSRILFERTDLKLQSLQTGFGTKFLRQNLIEILGKQDLAITCKEHSDNVKPLEPSPFTEDLLQGLLADISPSKLEQITGSNQRASLTKADLLRLYGLIQTAYPSLNDHSHFLNDNIKRLRALEAEGKETVEYNMSNNIPAKLSDVDSLFYDLDKSVEMVLLEKLHHDMAESLKNLSKVVSPAQSFDSNESFINEMGDIDLGSDDLVSDDLNNDDILSFGDLTLKKSN